MVARQFLFSAIMNSTIESTPLPNHAREPNFLPMHKVTRAARALIGWMTADDARRYSTNHSIGKSMTPAQDEHAARARDIVANRSPFCERSDKVLFEAGSELKEYIAQFTAQAEFEIYRKEGWNINIADLSKVCALQHRVFWDYSVEQTAGLAGDDPLSLARVTLPLAIEQRSLAFQIEEQSERWMVASDNPNLQIRGHFSDRVDVGDGRNILALGFLVGVEQSYVQVIRHRGRYLLRDGYHRALGLLASGITHAPVLTREYPHDEPLGFGSGNVSHQIFLGDRPPLLPDYLDNSVSSEVQLSADRYLISVDVNKICLGI